MNYRCECGGMFHLNKAANEETVHDVTIGHMHTDLLSIKIDGIEYLLKTENLLPTGSFKDRGAYTLINEIHHVGIEKIALDSAGNAGASIAAYAAAADIDCTVYVPKETSPDKLRQIAAYGARIVKTEGGRTGACQAVKENLGDAYYASHVYNPLFFEGMKAMAYEIYEQLGESVPEYIFLPVGNGTMLLGLYYGFIEIGRLPPCRARTVHRSTRRSTRYRKARRRRRLPSPSASSSPSGCTTCSPLSRTAAATSSSSRTMTS